MMNQRNNTQIPEDRFPGLAMNALSLAPTGIYIYDLQNKQHTYVNPRQIEITGYTLDDLLQLDRQDFEAIFHPDDMEAIRDHLLLLESANDGEVFEVDYRRRIKSGDWVWFRNRSAIFSRDEQGCAKEFLGFIWDISATKKIELELVSTRASAQQYLDVAEVMLIGLDTERRVTLVNPKGCRVLGYEQKDVIGHDWFADFILSEETEGVEELYAGIIAGDKEPQKYFENHVVCWDGSRKLIAWHSSVTRDSDGCITGVLSSGQDITTQRANEERTRQSFEQMVSVLEGLEVVVYVADMETYEILYVNDYTKQLVGDVVGKICWQKFHVGQEKPCEFCTNERLVDADGHPTGLYSWHLHNEKLGRWYKLMDKAIIWHDGRTVRLEIATDITEMKFAEAEKLSLIQELEETLEEVTALRGIIPICSFCKKIRDDAGYWERVESYITKHSAAKFSHGICPDCLKENYPDD